MRCFPAVLVTAIVCACGGDGTPKPYAESDSAGVVIQQLPLVRDADDTIAVSTQPVLELGGTHADSAYELDPDNYALMSATTVSTHVVVADKTRLKVFDTNGQLVNVVGRRGGGPGEFTQIIGLCTFNDSILVMNQTGHVTVFNPDHTFNRSFRPNDYPVPNTCFPDGSILTQQTAQRGSTTTTYRRVGTSGNVMAVYVGLPATQYQPTMREISFAVRGSDLIVGAQWSNEVKIFNDSARLARIIRWADETRSVPADSSLAVGGPVPMGRSGDVSAAEAASVDVPSFRRILVDQWERIWLLTEWKVNSDRQWSIIAADGKSVERLVVPDALIPRQRVNVYSVANGMLALKIEGGGEAARLQWLSMNTPK